MTKLLEKGGPFRDVVDFIGRSALTIFLVVAGIVVVLYLGLGALYFAYPGLIVSCPMTMQSLVEPPRRGPDNRGPVEFFVDWVTWPKFVGRDEIEARKEGVSSYNYWLARDCNDPQRRREIEQGLN